jgi:putative ATPase
MASAFDAEFVSLSAILSGVKDIRDAIAQAQHVLQQSGRHTMLFVDEVHRFNKSQQDTFLPFVEQGLITFVGATTENPSFEVINALLSRVQVYTLKSLSVTELGQLLERTKKLIFVGVEFEDGVQERIVSHADGDARRLLNVLEQLEAAVQGGSAKRIDATLLDATLVQGVRRFDKNGEAFYDQISALHKSVRGSNPDAALYWMMRMLDGGMDPRYLARRIVRMAWEDIGLADPRAIQLTLNAAQTYEQLGSPEGELALAQAVLYMAAAAKSNAGYVAYNAARDLIAQDQSRPVPLHLRNAPTKLMQKLDYGKGYRYAHNEEEGYAAGENYFPDGMPEVHFYQPTKRGLEEQIFEKMARLRELDAATSKHKK